MKSAGTLAAAALVCIVMLLGMASPATAATLSVDLDTASPYGATGTLPFDADNAPGNDSGPDNDVVRTNDTITYHWAIRVNDGPSTDTTVTQTLPVGMVWDGLPAYCLTSGTPVSALSDAGRTITCNLGTKPQGSADDYSPIAQVDGSLINGDTLPTSITVSSSDSGTADASAGPVTTTVSAAPLVNLRKERALPASVPSYIGGDYGYVVSYPISLAVEAANGKGSRGLERLQQPLGFTDDLPANIPGAVLVDCVRGGIPALPGGAGAAAGSVTGSGNINCSQTAAGDDISISIDGADLTGEHVPTQNADGSPVAANTAYLAVYRLRIWVPEADILPADSISITNTYTGFNPVGASGAPNFGASGEPTVDNSATYLLQRRAPTPGWVQGLKCFNPVGGSYWPCSWNDNQHVYPGDVFWGQFIVQVGGTVGVPPVDDVMACDTIDNTSYRLSTEGLANPATDPLAWPVGASVPATIEYGTGGTRGHGLVGAGSNVWYGTPTSQRGDSCGDADSPTGWTTDARDPAHGGIENITKVRVTAHNPVGVGQFFAVRMNLKAYDNDPTTSDPIPQGTILANFLKYAHDSGTVNPNWSTNTYNPNDGSGNALEGARLVLARGDARIAKDTIPAGKASAATGEVVTYSLQPSVTGYDLPGGIMRDVIVTDLLSEHMDYQPGSASTPPTRIETVGAQTQLVWELGDLSISDPVPVITYDARVKFSAGNGVDAVNVVQIESPDDFSHLAYRYDFHTIRINRISGLVVIKSTGTPWVEPGDDLTFQIEYGNNSTTTLPSMEAIDVLPYDGDSRGSAFTGTARLADVTVHDGETVYYTATGSASVDPDPQDPSNDLGTGSTQWCEAGEFSDPGCPAAIEDATAVRVIHTTPVPVGVSHEFELILETAGNGSGDAYFNDVTTYGDGVTFSPTSAPVVDRVVASELGDYVWYDANSDGVQEPGEALASGVDVTLTGTDKHGVAVSRTTTTDGGGLYLFEDLVSGGYKITFTAPSGYEFTQRGVGADRALDSDVDSATGQTGPITIDTPIPLQTDQSDLDWDAGLVPMDGQVTIEKVALPEGSQAFDFTTTGGLAPGDAFTLFDDGSGAADSITRTVPGDGNTYTITEGAVPTGWSLIDLDCQGTATFTTDLGAAEVEVTVGPGETVSCVFTNRRNPLPTPAPPPQTPPATPSSSSPLPVSAPDRGRGVSPSQTRTRKPRLVLRKAANRKRVRPGQRIRYRIAFRNAARGTVARRVQICDRLPRGLSVVRLGSARMREGKLCWTLRRLPFSRKAHSRSFVARVTRTVRPGSKVVNVVRAGKVQARAVSRVIAPKSSDVSPADRGGGVTG